MIRATGREERKVSLGGMPKIPWGYRVVRGLSTLTGWEPGRKWSEAKIAGAFEKHATPFENDLTKLSDAIAQHENLQKAVEASREKLATTAKAFTDENKNPDASMDRLWDLVVEHEGAVGEFSEYASQLYDHHSSLTGEEMGNQLEFAAGYAGMLAKLATNGTEKQMKRAKDLQDKLDGVFKGLDAIGQPKVGSLPVHLNPEHLQTELTGIQKRLSRMQETLDQRQQTRELLEPEANKAAAEETGEGNRVKMSVNAGQPRAAGNAHEVLMEHAVPLGAMLAEAVQRERQTLTSEEVGRVRKALNEIRDAHAAAPITTGHPVYAKWNASVAYLRQMLAVLSTLRPNKRSKSFQLRLALSPA